MSADEDDNPFSAAMFRGFVFRNTMHNSFDAQEIIDGVFLGSYDAACADVREFEKR